MPDKTARLTVHYGAKTWLKVLAVINTISQIEHSRHRSRREGRDMP
ncbi:MAG: hypothetical protein RLZZ574_2826 [Cyanobacteriota bacterium]|jgi:hypothetical protein